MAKKFINAENLIYSLGVFEKRMTDVIEKITDMAHATISDLTAMMDDVIGDSYSDDQGAENTPETPEENIPEENTPAQ